MYLEFSLEFRQFFKSDIYDFYCDSNINVAPL